MNLIVAGDRDFTDYTLLKKKQARLTSIKKEQTRYYSNLWYG